MKVLNQSSKGLKRSYDVLISAKVLEEEIMKELKETASSVKMDGFRPGKVPIDIVKRMYGDGVRAEAIKKAVKNAASKIMAEEKLTVSINYKTDIIKDDERGVEFRMNFEVVPSIELKDISSLEIIKHVVELSEEHSLEAINRIKDLYVKWIPIDKEDKKSSIKDGYKVDFDLVMMQDGKKIKSIKSCEVVVGDERLIDNFSANFIGLKPGESKEFFVNYPKDEKDKKLAGKQLTYSVDIKNAHYPSKYELDEELATKLEMKSLDELKSWSKNISEKKFEEISIDLMRRELLEKMAELYDFEVPENMLNIEYAEVVRQISEEATAIGKEMTPEIREECKKIATQRVRLGFVVAEIAKKENITVTQNEIAQYINEIALNYPGKEKEIWNYYTDKKNMSVVIGPILEKKVINFLFDNVVKIKEKKCTREEAIKLDEEQFDFFKDESETKEIKTKKAEGKSSKKKEAAVEPKEVAAEEKPEDTKSISSRASDVKTAKTRKKKEEIA